MASYWDQFQGYLAGQPQPTIYSADLDNLRFPSIMPENSPYLVPLIRGGEHPPVPLDWLIRALAYHHALGNVEPSPGNAPARSPLGSGFEFPFIASYPQVENIRWDQIRKELQR